ncbi:hypothetical protein D3C80_1303450 [compost metagenome]
MLARQHQVVAALSVQRHLLAGQRAGQPRRMRATTDQHLAGIERALVAGQADPAAVQPPAIDLRLYKAHATGLGRFEQFAHHPVGVDEVPGTWEEQPTLQRRAQLRRRLAHGVGRPEVHRHRLLLHACAQGFQGLARLRPLEHQQRAIFLEQLAAPDRTQQPLPGTQAAFVQRADAGHAALKRARAQV